MERENKRSNYEKKGRTSFKFFVGSAASTVLLCLVATTAALAYTYDDLILIGKLEKQVFGRESTAPLSERLETAEKTVFGTVQSGTESVRIRNACRKANIQSSFLDEPLAPEAATNPGGKSIESGLRARYLAINKGHADSANDNEDNRTPRDESRRRHKTQKVVSGNNSPSTEAKSRRRSDTADSPVSVMQPSNSKGPTTTSGPSMDNETTVEIENDQSVEGEHAERIVPAKGEKDSFADATSISEGASPDTEIASSSTTIADDASQSPQDTAGKTTATPPKTSKPDRIWVTLSGLFEAVPYLVTGMAGMAFGLMLQANPELRRLRKQRSDVVESEASEMAVSATPAAVSPNQSAVQETQGPNDVLMVETKVGSENLVARDPSGEATSSSGDDHPGAVPMKSNGETSKDCDTACLSEVTRGNENAASALITITGDFLDASFSMQNVDLAGSGDNRLRRQTAANAEDDSTAKNENSHGCSEELDWLTRSEGNVVQVESFLENLAENSQTTIPPMVRSSMNDAALDANLALETAAHAPDLTDAGTYKSRAKQRMLQQDALGAMQDYAEALLLDPQDAEIYSNRAIARLTVGDQPGALDDLSHCLMINSHDVTALRNRAALLQSIGDHDGAGRDLTVLLAQHPMDEDALTSRADSKLRRTDFEGAIADSTRALCIHPHSRAAFKLRGTARLQAGDLKGALQDLTQALRLNPGDAETYVLRTRVRAALDNEDAAVMQHFEQTI